MPNLPEGFSDTPPDLALPQVAQRESGNRNLPPTANYDYPRSHASGIYQDQPRTWQDWTRASGIGTQYSEAYLAPRSVQTAVNEWGRQKYGVNASETWAASAPRGGYKALPVGFSATKPKANLPEGFSAAKPAIIPGQMGPNKPPDAAVDPHEQLRRDLGLPSIGQVRAKIAEGDPEIQARIKQLPPQTLAAMMRDPKNPMWVRIIGGTMGAAADAVPDLPGLAKRVGAETAAGVATPETAGDVAQLAFGAGMGSPALGIKSPAIRTADGRVVEGPNHPAIRAAGTEGEPGFTTGKNVWVTREEGADIAKAANQAPPDTESLHSEDLRPASAGAMATDKAILDGYKAVPPVPANAFIQSIDDGGQRLRGAATSDMGFWRQFRKTLPSELQDARLQERFNEFKEDGMKWGDYSILSAPEQEAFKKYALPIAQENADIFGELKKFSPEMFQEFDPEGYVHRPRKGMTKEFDPWMGEAGEANPMGGFRSRTAPALKDRVYYVMENEAGQRRVIAVTDHGPMLLSGKDQPGTPLPRYQGTAKAPGDKFSINGENWTIKQAKVSEIEGVTSASYYKNFMANAIKSNLQLKAAARAVNELKRLKETPEWQAYTVPVGSKNIPDGYVVPQFPPFRTHFMDPKMAAAIDSFWTAPRMALGPKVTAINRFLVQSLFWSPLVHAGNVGTHWFVARGFDWLNPLGYSRMLKTFPQAVVEVATQGPIYREMLRDGSGLVYGSVANAEFHRMMLKGLGEAITREPWKWDPIARKFGVGPSDLARAIYSASNRLLWGTSDAFMVQRVLELREKGMGKLESIEEAEKHIPNYRIPSQVLGRPGVAAILKDPSLFMFSRYDYGVFKSYAEMAKDLTFAKDSKGVWKFTDPKTKLKAVGNIMALGFLTYYVWPYISQALQNLTGDKDIEFGPRGALKLPMLARDLASGGKHLGDILSSLITLAPVPSLAITAFSGFRDYFGRNIVEPGDWQAGRWGRVGAQAGEYVAQQLPLYGEAAQGMEDRRTGGLRGAGERVLRQGLGIRRTPKPYFGRTGGGGTYEQQAGYRRTHPRGPIEQLEKRAEEWLRQ